MKFSEITEDKWKSLKPYLDTAILPFTGLTGLESPYEATLHLEQLRDWLDTVEQPFNGRTVTYPAYHFTPTRLAELGINDIITNLKTQGFNYVVAVTAKHDLQLNQFSFDAIIAPADETSLPDSEQASHTIIKMWSQTS